jgi:hypothetical protein
MWGSPLKAPKPSKPVKEKTEKPLPVFKPEKLNLPKSEVKKILFYSGNLSRSQILWTQNWLEQKIRERSLPPQLAKEDAFGQIVSFLAPESANALLAEIRADFQKTLPPEAHKEADDFGFLLSLANEAYHEHLPPPQTSSRNSRTPDDGHESD